jgi:hypothetical protein
MKIVITLEIPDDEEAPPLDDIFAHLRRFITDIYQAVYPADHVQIQDRISFNGSIVILDLEQGQKP